MAKYWCLYCCKLSEFDKKRADCAMDKSMTCPFCNAGVMDLFPVKNCGMKVPDDAKHGDIIAYPTEERKG